MAELESEIGGSVNPGLLYLVRWFVNFVNVHCSRFISHQSGNISAF